MIKVITSINDILVVMMVNIYTYIHIYYYVQFQNFYNIIKENHDVIIDDFILFR